MVGAAGPLGNCILGRRLFRLKSFILTPYRTSLFLAVVSLLLLAGPLRADHIVGGEFQYLCLGWKDGDPGTGIKVYQMYLNVYRDCIGTGACFDGGDQLSRAAPKETCAGATVTPMNVTVYDGETLFSRYATTDLKFSGRFTDVDVNLGNPCLVLTEQVCQELYTYEFTLELPVSENAYTIAYQRCCRNESIRNITNGNSIGATYFIQILPEAQVRENDSPRFNIFPPIAICINADFRIDLGARDNDNDSLSYQMCDAKIGAGQDGLDRNPDGTVRYNTPSFFDDLAPRVESPYPYSSVDYLGPRYDVDNQLGIGSELRIDPVTGELSGRPIYPGTHVIAICVEEWSRDSVPVLLSSTKREFQLSVSRCGSTVTADLEETEIDALGRFYIKQCGFGPNTIINESTRESSIESYDWELIGPGGALLTGSDRDLTTSIYEEGVYEGTMFLNRESFAENCKDTAAFLLEVFPGMDPDFDATEVVCDPMPVSFTDLSTTEGSQRITGYEWSFGDTTTAVSRSVAPVHQYRQGGTFPVTLSLTDENGCQDAVTKDVPYYPSPRTIILEPQGAFGCAPLSNQFVNLSVPISDEYEFEWGFGDGNGSAERDPVHVYEDSGLFDVYLRITSPIGCVVDTTFLELVDVRDTPTANFAINPAQPTTEFPTFTVIDQSIGANNFRYSIMDLAGTELLSSPMADFEYRLRDTSTVFVQQIVSHPSGCRDTMLQSISLELVNGVKVPNAFTPNGDGVNDNWRPKGFWDGASGYQLRIWDRWGEMIFVTNDFDAAWDGTFEGKNSPGGGYLWDLSFVNSQGKVESFKGGVVLIR